MNHDNEREALQSVEWMLGRIDHGNARNSLSWIEQELARLKVNLQARAEVKPLKNTAPLNGGTCSSNGPRPVERNHGCTEVGEQNNCTGGGPEAAVKPVQERRIKDAELSGSKRHYVSGETADGSMRWLQNKREVASTGNTEERE